MFGWIKESAVYEVGYISNDSWDEETSSYKVDIPEVVLFEASTVIEKGYLFLIHGTIEASDGTTEILLQANKLEKQRTDDGIVIHISFADGSTFTEGLLTIPYSEEGSSGIKNIWDSTGTGAVAGGDSSSVASGLNSFAIGAGCTASGANSQAMGNQTETSVQAAMAHAEGNQTKATSTAAHAEGSSTTASGFSSHAEGGQNTKATNAFAHAEGLTTTSSGTASHAEGMNTVVSGNNAHGEGKNCSVTGENAHGEGEGNTAGGIGSHTEGNACQALAPYSHVEGSSTIIMTGSGGSHAEGNGCLIQANCNFSHAEGNGCVIKSNYSHAEGTGTIAAGTAQHVGGEYNIEDSTSLEIIGNGTTNGRSNARTLNRSGNEWLAGQIQPENGLRLKAPNGTYYNVTVDNTGALSITAVT
jgi:hypothetical protein